MQVRVRANRKRLILDAGDLDWIRRQDGLDDVMAELGAACQEERDAILLDSAKARLLGALHSLKATELTGTLGPLRAALEAELGAGRPPGRHTG